MAKLDREETPSKWADMGPEERIAHGQELERLRVLAFGTVQDSEDTKPRPPVFASNVERRKAELAFVEAWVSYLEVVHGDAVREATSTALEGAKKMLREAQRGRDNGARAFGTQCTPTQARRIAQRAAIADVVAWLSEPSPATEGRAVDAVAYVDALYRDLPSEQLRDQSRAITVHLAQLRGGGSGSARGAALVAKWAATLHRARAKLRDSATKTNAIAIVAEVTEYSIETLRDAAFR